MQLFSPVSSAREAEEMIRLGATVVVFRLAPGDGREGAVLRALPELGKYCRARGIKLLVELEGAFDDRRLAGSRDLLLELNQAGVDALRLNDLGLARVARALAPELPLQAGEGLSVHSLSGVRGLAKLGFSRVTLAREAGLEDIRFICATAPVPVDLYCAGRMCPGYRGKCMLPAPGQSLQTECTGACRLPFSFFGDAPAAHLSMKDLSLIGHLEELGDAGVSGLIIGEMDPPGAAKLATRLYRTCMDEGRKPSRDELYPLELCSSAGLSVGYLSGKKAAGLFGEPIPRDRKLMRKLARDLGRLGADGGERQSVPLRFALSAKEGEALVLDCVSDEGMAFSAPGPLVGSWGRRGGDETALCAVLEDLDGTIFTHQGSELALDPGVTVPLSLLKTLKARCLEGQLAIRTHAPKRPAGDWQPGLSRLPYPDKPGRVFSFLKIEQITPTLLEMRPDFLYLPLFEAAAHPGEVEELLARGHEVAPVLDRVIFDSQWTETLEALRELRRAGVGSLVCSDPGQLELLRPLKFSLRGDLDLAAYNAQSMKELRRLGACSLTLSPRLTFSQIRQMSLSMDSELIAYGRLPVLYSETCLIGRRGAGCTCDTAVSLTDRQGKSFPLVAEHHCRNTMYHGEKLWLADRLGELDSLGVRWLRLSFTTENARECETVAHAYLHGRSSATGRMFRGYYE